MRYELITKSTGWKIRDSSNGYIGMARYLSEDSANQALTRANQSNITPTIKFRDKKNREYEVNLSRPLKRIYLDE
jgi:hypothetical protein